MNQQIGPSTNEIGWKRFLPPLNSHSPGYLTACQLSEDDLESQENGLETCIFKPGAGYEWATDTLCLLFFPFPLFSVSCYTILPFPSVPRSR
jgi:hypothetical protein